MPLTRTIPINVYSRQLKKSFPLLLLAAYAYASVNGVDPSAASFPLVGRNANVGYTGDFNWSETLMTVPGRNGLGVDLVLSYNSNIGIDQESSWVGLGFDFTVGFITRAVINMPDEYLPSAPGAKDCGVFCQGKEYHQWDDPMGDEEDDPYIKPQDRFFLILPGGGGEIVAADYEELEGANTNDVNNITFHCAAWRAWKIVPTFDVLPPEHPRAGERYIKSFTVTTEDGTVYKFEDPCWSQISVGQHYESRIIPTDPKLGWPINEYGDFYIDPTGQWGSNDEFDIPPAPYIWFLKEILSPDYVDVNQNGFPDDADKGNWVKLTYDYYTDAWGGDHRDRPAEGYEYYTRLESYHYDWYKQGSDWVCREWFRQNRTKIHMACLDEIETPTHRADFFTTYRYASSG